jgi:hypothetical protein
MFAAQPAVAITNSSIRTGNRMVRASALNFKRHFYFLLYPITTDELTERTTRSRPWAAIDSSIFVLIQSPMRKSFGANQHI